MSKGLGSAFFDIFHAAGDRVLALGRTFTGTQRAAQRHDPDRIRLRTVDLADLASLPGPAELAPIVDADPSSELVVVHNAGVFEPFGPIGELGTSEIARTVTINLTAPFALTDALLTRPIPATRPVTVAYISSAAARNVEGGRAVYGATKLAGEMFFATLARERDDRPGFRVVIVDPGIMDTEMQAVVRRHAREDTYFPGRQRFLERYESGALPSPADVARRILDERLCRA